MSSTDAQEVARGAAMLLRLHREHAGRWTPLPHQIPPPPGFYGWLLLAGRGAGKTDTCAKYMVDHVKGPPCLSGPHPHWMGIIAPTQGDAATSCFSGPSGISAHDPSAKMVSTIGGTVIRWPNGSEAKLFGAHSVEDTERLRSGGNRCLQWLEELAAWRYLDATWAQMRFGLRSGPRPHWIGSTTPKPRSLIKKFDQGAFENVVISRASMYDNPHLPEDIKQALLDEYAGTSLGAQELLGQIVDQVEGAMWQRTLLEAARVRPGEVPDLAHVVVGVDPSGGAGEQGIIVGGRSKELWMPSIMPVQEGIVPAKPRPQKQGYVLADYTCQLQPDGWGRRAVQAAVDHEADEILVEVNYGGDMALSTVRSAADAMGIPIRIRKITATRGKVVRAQPVSALSSQGRWHLAGNFEELEDQLCTWTDDLDWSPDRLDAMVWDAHGLKLAGLTGAGVGTLGSDVARRALVGPGAQERPTPTQTQANYNPMNRRIG
jgi:phage terminase large subunit-like protein